MINSDSTENWEHGPGAPVETPDELLIKGQVRGRQMRKQIIGTQRQSAYY